MKRTIRPLAESDIDSLQAIDRQAHGEDWSARTFMDEVERDDRVHLVAEADGSILGHASMWIDGSSGRVTNVAVAPGHTGQGHASVLLAELIQQALATTSVSNLQLEVRAANRRAQRLYSRFGFVPVGVERNFYGRGDVLGNRDALVMAVADVCSPTWRERLDQLAAHQDGADAGATV